MKNCGNHYSFLCGLSNFLEYQSSTNFFLAYERKYGNLIDYHGDGYCAYGGLLTPRSVGK